MSLMVPEPSKRTRSQVVLSDELGEVSLGISPLKAARQGRRRNEQSSSYATPGSSVPDDVGVDEDDQSDDELLLSPVKIRPQKRPPTSPHRGTLLENSIDRQLKRLKTEHAEDQPTAEAKRPAGPFDFSFINERQSPTHTSPEQPGSPSKKRAQSVPTISPGAVPLRDLRRLMSSPPRSPSISPIREALHFSSIPRIPELPADSMSIDDVVTPSRVDSECSGVREDSHATLDLGASGHTSLQETPTEPASDAPSHTFPPVPSTLEVIASNVYPLDLSTLSEPLDVTPRASPRVKDSELTPKVIAPLASVLDLDPITIPPTNLVPSPLPDPLSPLSALSSFSEFDPASPLTNSGPRSSVEPPSLPPLPTRHSSVDAPVPSQVPLTGTTTTHGEARTVGIAVAKTKGRRVPVRSSGPARLTRSASMKKKEAKPKERKPIIISTSEDAPSATSSLSSGTSKLHSDLSSTASSSSKSSSGAMASYKKSFSFAMPTSSSLSKTVGRLHFSSPQKKPLSLPKQQPPRIPSPTKPASSIGASTRPQALQAPKHNSLSNLSLALEKLKMPPPVRPATTLGFNRATDPAGQTLDPGKPPLKAKDDSAVRLGNVLPSNAKGASTPLKRAVTLGSISSHEANASASSSKLPTTTTQPVPPPPKAAPPVKRINVHTGMIAGKNPFSKPRGLTFTGVGNRRPFVKVSKKSSLPVVEGSPVKGGEVAQVADSPGPPLPALGEMLPPALTSHERSDGQAVAPLPLNNVEPMDLSEAPAESSADGGADGERQEDGAETWKHASRRASMASQFLQQTLAVLPSTPSPQKPSSLKGKAVERPQSGSPSTRKLRSSTSSNATNPRSAPGGLPKGKGVAAHVSKSSSTVAGSSAAKTSSLKVLKPCTVFVDVRTDDGDDAGGLFVDMLRGLGAKIIGRAGQSCTHIVYKNGLMSTLTKYRLMRDPKPLVVGISWVVECAEQRRRVEEDNFLVDLEGANVAGNNKRRRSMLPKHISSNLHAMPPPPPPSSSLTGASAGDGSMDSSSVDADHSLGSSDVAVDDEDDLPPLERARQRRNIFFKH
ncbi:hypothetical protein BC834DRAFT_939601 [Gloeopeniophorella convolvens]|nr:hypothetical protein BC834DRAFT_939601 [Gloeopeniophorella convolvens]